MSRSQSPVDKKGAVSAVEASSANLGAEQRPLLDTATVRIPAAAEQQRAHLSTRLLSAMIQAGGVVATPFKWFYNHPKTAVLLLTAGANAAAQTCVHGVGQMAGAPQAFCTAAANTVGQNPAAVAGVAGTLFALASHYVTREAGLYREQQNAAETETAPAPKLHQI
ncbi:MAG: hypothetical protein A3F13_01450 [Gammaproteobacteria bacterium RIFCSPHIGHO2_12_FULL_40_19]|nr:MAG: hypothetical protein A3F13_01450 [Gammaproteobacteria bacterium RIFCSPHIGHO2_12_FULL_40_19]